MKFTRDEIQGRIDSSERSLRRYQLDFAEENATGQDTAFVTRRIAEIQKAIGFWVEQLSEVIRQGNIDLGYTANGLRKEVAA